jgi:hypothetical protein
MPRNIPARVTGDCCRSGSCRRLCGMLTARLGPGSTGDDREPGLLVQPPQPGNAIAIGIRSRRQAARRVFSRDKLGQSANPAHAAIAQCCLEVASTLSRLASVSPARHCPDEKNAEHRPAVEGLPPGWPDSNRNGRDQIGISGRLRSEHEDAFPVKREATPAVQVRTQRR